MKRFSVFLLVLGLNLVACIPVPSTSGTPEATATITSPRHLGRTYNFTWQEKWRLFPIDLDYNTGENMRNLVATQDGLVISNHPDWRGNVELKYVGADGGERKWAIDVDGEFMSICTDGHLLYTIGYQDREVVLVAYNLETGKQVWKSKTFFPDHRGYTLILQNEDLYVYTSGKQRPIYQFDSKTGELVETINTEGHDGWTLLKSGDETIWYRSDTNQLVLSQPGKIVWEIEIEEEGVGQFPLIYQGILLVKLGEAGQTIDDVAAIDLKTGRIIWHHSGEAYSNLILEDGLLYVISASVTILVLDPETGEIVGWGELIPYNINPRQPMSAIAVKNDMMYVYLIDSREVVTFEKIN